MSDYADDTGPVIDDDSADVVRPETYLEEILRNLLLPDSIDPQRDLLHYGNINILRTAVLNGSLPLDLLTDEQQRALQVGPYDPEQVVSEDDLLNGDPDLTGGEAADDLQIESILGQAQEFSSGANGFAAVWEELPEDLGKLEKQLIEDFQNRLLAGGGIGWEHNPADGDSIFFKLPVVIPGMSGIIKIKIRNPDGTFKSPGEITASIGESIQNTVNEVVTLPGRLLDQAKTILEQGGDLAEILAGTSSKTLEEAVGDVFGGIFNVEGVEEGVWEVLIGQLSGQLIDQESIEDGLFDLGDLEADITDPNDTKKPIIKDPTIITDPVFDNNTEDTEEFSSDDVETTNPDDGTKKPRIKEGTIITDPVFNNNTTVTTETPVDGVEIEEVVEPPSGGGGGGGGSVGGMFSPHIGGIGYKLPQFTGVPYKLDKDYNVSLNRIIEENLFSDFDVA